MSEQKPGTLATPQQAVNPLVASLLSVLNAEGDYDVLLRDLRRIGSKTPEDDVKRLVTWLVDEAPEFARRMNNDMDSSPVYTAIASTIKEAGMNEFDARKSLSAFKEQQR